MSDERRIVTVLFADVAGSTALGEALDPEDLRVLLGRYYSIARDVVGAHGGTVEKFIGDAVMAVFGLRRAHGDDAVRAISAALELRDRVRSDARLGDRMPIRLGVNTGDVVASRAGGDNDFLVTGDAVNIAARLQQAAAPWSILVGKRALRAARSEFRFGPLQHVEAKGKSAPVEASEVIGRAHALTSRTPIFGRDADLAQLELVARRAFDEQRPFMVSVIAPAGTGKTRLLEEFLARLPRVDTTARVAVAQCLPYGAQLTYWPLRAVLFRLLSLDEDAPPAEVRRAISDWLARSNVEDAAGVGELLASTVGAGESETADRAGLFAAWRTFVEAASQQAPLVVAVEDLHWSSDTLLDLFEHVLQPRADTRALLIALARPELLDRRPGWGGGRRNHVSISLEPLDDTATEKLVRTLAEGAPKVLVDAIVARAEGNPFFAGEIVNSVLEGATRFDDAEQVEAALARLPDNVRATVLARLDALPDEERETLRLGSVYGRAFRPSGVAALLAGATQDEQADICERLAERDLIRPSGADGYAFRHILIREVAYSTLPRSTRAQLHAAAGRWLEERSAGREEAFAELVAYHYREAASLATAMDLDGAADLRDVAREWLVRAADVARAAAATIEARAHVRAALDFARPDDLPELYELLGDVEIGGSAITDAYRRALELARESDRAPHVQLRVLAKLLLTETRYQGSVADRPSVDEINAYREEGRLLLELVDDPRAKALFLTAEGFYPFWVAHASETVEHNQALLAPAEQAAEAALALAREIGDYNLQSAALDALGSIAQARGQWRRSIELGQRRIAMAAHLVLFEQIDALRVTTWGAVVAGDLATADATSAAGLAVIQPGQAPDWTLHLAAWRCVVLQLVGKWDELESAAERAYRLWIESGRPAAGYAVRGFASALLVARARRDIARSERWVEVITTIDELFSDDPLRTGAAIMRGDAEDLREAVEHDWQRLLGSRLTDFGWAVSRVSDEGMTLSEDRLADALDVVRRMHLTLGEAEILRALGIARADPALLSQARAIFAASGAAPFEARTRCELALITGDHDGLEAGLAYLESIRDVVQVERYLKRWSDRAGRQAARG